MKKIVIGFVILAGIIYSCKTNSTDAANAKKVKIVFEAKSNSEVSGEGSFIQKNGFVTFKAKVKGLKPGVHAIHIHEKSDCSAADATSTGGHWNPTFKKHGKWGEGEYHKGDIGNFTTDIYGQATIVFKTDEWCIGCGDPTKDILGKGLIIHENPDDLITQPTGNAGGRVACSAIIK